MYKTINLKKLVISLLIPLLVGGAAALLTMNSGEVWKGLNRPPLSPPGWVFPVVWTVLYLMMGAAYYMASTGRSVGSAYTGFYAAQLLVNFLWPIVFFRFQMYKTALLVLELLWVLVLVTTVLFGKRDKAAGLLMVPYLLWITFALYLNIGVAVLNP